VAIKLGQIIVEMLAETGNFISGIDKATQVSKKQAKEIHSAFSEMGSKIGTATQEAMSSLGQFGGVVGNLASTAMEAFSGIGKSSSGIATAVTALGGLAVAAVAAGAGLLEMAKGGAEVVEHLAHISEKTGISIRDLQVFEAAGKTVGVSLDEMVIGMRRFDQAITGFGKGAAAQGILRELGVTAKDNKEALLQTADAFQKMTDPVRRANDAVALFGRSGLSMIPILMKGREGIAEWEKAVDKLGPTIGKDAVDANEKYRASIENMSLAWDKLKVNLSTAILPTLSKTTNWFAENAQAIKAGLLGGGVGAAKVLADQLAAQAASIDETKKQSAAQDALLRKGEEIQSSLQKNFEIQKVGGTAAYALEQARQKLADDIQSGLWKQASAIQSQIPELQKAADLEALRAARAIQIAASYKSLQESFAKGGASPLFKSKPIDLTKGTEALFGPQTKNPLEGAPDIGGMKLPDFSAGLALLGKDLTIGKNALDDFYTTWDKQSKGTADSINKTYDEQWAHFNGLLALGEINLQQFKDVEDKINRERAEGLKRARQESGTSTFSDAWQDMFKELEASGKDFARSITSDIGNAITQLNGQLAQFIATGKGLNIKAIGQGLTESITGSLLKKGESSFLSALGLGDGSKPDGSSANKALFVQMAGLGGSADAIGTLPLGNLGNIASMLGLGGATTTGSVIPASSSGSLFGSGGIGGFFSGLLGLLPHLAGGGDTQPGRAYVVGEKRPELFVPRTAGTIVPTVPSTKGGSVQHIQQTFNISTPDADSSKGRNHKSRHK
jgi:hypothetical protein